VRVTHAMVCMAQDMAVEADKGIKLSESAEGQDQSDIGWWINQRRDAATALQWSSGGRYTMHSSCMMPPTKLGMHLPRSLFQLKVGALRAPSAPLPPFVACVMLCYAEHRQQLLCTLRIQYCSSTT
jgi:hypothetical protein